MTAIFSVVLSSNAAADTGLEWRRGSPQRPVESGVQHQMQPPRDEAVRTAAFNESRNGRRSGGTPTGSARFRSIMVQRENRPETVRSSQLPSRDDDLFDEPPRATIEELPEVDTFGLPEEETFGLPDEEGSLLDETEEIETYRTPQDFQPPTSESRPGTRQPGAREPREELRDLDEMFEDESDENYALGATNMEEEKRKAQEFCSEALADLKINTLDKVDLDITVSGREGEDIPYECSIDDGTQFSDRCWAETIYMWKASALCHKPLYFEDEQLERYGHSWGPCLQPIISGAHFFGTLPVLPYCMGVEPPLECVYALGHYRPGSCAPYMCNPVPLSTRAGVIQAGAVVGAAAAIP